MAWRDVDLTAYFRKKSRKCAEILVPERAGADFLIGGEEARSCIRLSLGTSNTLEQVEELAGAIEESVGHLRRIAPATGPRISTSGGMR